MNGSPVRPSSGLKKLQKRIEIKSLMVTELINLAQHQKRYKKDQRSLPKTKPLGSRKNEVII
jgi:hypothetical protein